MTTREQQKANCKKWLEALRSGEYEQGYDGYLEYEGKYCCLGVGCMALGVKASVKQASPGVFVTGFGVEEDYLSAPTEFMDAVGLATPSGEYKDEGMLTSDNDDYNLSFSEIADIIESEPEGLFKEELCGKD